MKKILLLLIFFFCCYLSFGQTSWTTSNNMNILAYGPVDTLNYSQLDPYYFAFYKQPMKTNFEVRNDSLYLIDSGKLETAAQVFFSRTFGTDTLLVVLDTNLFLSYPSYPNLYYDESTDPYGFQPYALQDHVLELNLGHKNSYIGKTIRYKSINYKMGNAVNQFDYSPKWQFSSLMPDTMVYTQPIANFFIEVEDNKIVINHNSDIISGNGYNLNLSNIKNDSMFAELYPSRFMFYSIPLKPGLKKTTSIYSWTLPRFQVASMNDFTDTLRIGYHYNAQYSANYQSVDWITIVKTSDSTITYSPATLPNLFKAFPIQELKLAAHIESRQNLITWTTLNEENLDFFELQKSKDGIKFETIHVEKAIGHTERGDYSYADENPSLSCYYRIKAVDIDKSYDYSNIISANRAESLSYSLYPNPNFGKFYIQGLSKEDYQIKILSLDGKTIYSQKVLGQNGSIPINIENLSKGTYIISIRDLETDNITSEKIIKE